MNPRANFPFISILLANVWTYKSRPLGTLKSLTIFFCNFKGTEKSYHRRHTSTSLQFLPVQGKTIFHLRSKQSREKCGQVGSIIRVTFSLINNFNQSKVNNRIFLSSIGSCENRPMIDHKNKIERSKWKTIDYWHSDELAMITVMGILGVIFVVVSYIVEFCHVSFFQRIFEKEKARFLLFSLHSDSCMCLPVYTTSLFLYNQYSKIMQTI